MNIGFISVRRNDLKTSELRDHIVAALEDMKGVNIVTLDVAALTPMTDHMVMVTGTSNRHAAPSTPLTNQQRPLACSRWALRAEKVTTGFWLILPTSSST